MADTEVLDTDPAIGLGCALESFTEYEEVKDLISGLPDFVKNKGDLEAVKQRFMTLLDRYQEQPHLLDQYLPKMLAQLVEIVLKPASEDHAHAACAFAAHFIKVRGYKVVVRHLPHEVHHVEPVMQMLEQQDAMSNQNWETRYFLLLWMSILVLIPFHMGRFDGAGSERGTLMDRIMSVCKRYLLTALKCKDGAAFLAAKFFTRPEVVKSHMPDFLDWAVRIVASKECDPDSVNHQLGALAALSAIYKHGKREDLKTEASTVLKVLLKSNLRDHHNSLVRKYMVKLVQRIGLLFLPAKVASWRYKRGNRSLALLMNGGDAPVQPEQPQVEVEDGDEDYEVPDELEDVIEELLTGLRSSETIIRWSAAKGVGRVTSRLPKELADDVVDSLLQLFSLRETDGAWHGGCLALAELARRGLLLPQRLPEVVSVVIRALVFDERRGCFSVGSHIRDAACYVCWAFARAYEPEVIRPQVPRIASSLLTVAVFDREVNCRRAASAAFQENVGRLGNLPHGIDILTKTDYHSVGSRPNTYLELSVYIAQYEDYRLALISHLAEKKVGHWDLHVRELAAKALNRLSSVAPSYLAESVMPQLLKNVESSDDLFLKHGSILAIGELSLGLSNEASKSGEILTKFFDAATLNRIKNIVLELEQKMSLRGSGGDLLRGAVTNYIQNISDAHFPCHGDNVVDLWKMVLDENLSSADPTVQEKSVAAVPSFVAEFYKDAPEAKADQLIHHYLSQLDVSEQHRRGFSQAVGNLPKFILEGRLARVLPALIERTKVNCAETEKWAEGRRDAVKAINAIVKTFGVSKGHKGDDTICEANIVPLYECYLACLEDYTIDRRGDIGAWVREAAMTGLSQLTLTATQTDPSLVPEVCIRQVMPRLAQQACEKIDRTRGHAAQTFGSILFADKPAVSGIPRRTEILELFPVEAVEASDDFAWAVESKTFPIFCKLLGFPEYSDRVLLGLVVSVGGLTERLVRFAGESLYQELRLMDEEQLGQFAATLLKLFEQNLRVDRVTVPLFKFLDQLLTSGHLDSILDDDKNEFSFELFNLVKREIAKTGEPNKLMSSAELMCALLQSADKRTVSKCLVQLSIYLCHKFPRIRKFTAAKLFEAILTYSDREIVPDEHLDEANTILSDTNWDLNVEELRPIRNRFCELVGVQPPAIIKKPV